MADVLPLKHPGGGVLDKALKPVKDRVSARELKGETIILDMKSDVYYYLNSVGSVAWAALDGQKTGNDLVDLLEQEFDAPREEIETDVLQLLTDLLAMGLVE